MTKIDRLQNDMMMLKQAQKYAQRDGVPQDGEFMTWVNKKLTKKHAEFVKLLQEQKRKERHDEQGKNQSA